MKKDDRPARISVVDFGGQWIVQIIEHGKLIKREFELEQDAKDFAAGQRLRLLDPPQTLRAPSRTRRRKL